MIDLAGLITGFADLSNPAPATTTCSTTWITTARAADLPHLHTFTRGLDHDRDAVNAGLTLPYHNGGTEGVNTKTKTDHATNARPRQLRPAPPPIPPRITSPTTESEPEPNRGHSHGLR